MAPSHYLNQCSPRSPMPYGITRPEFIKIFTMHYRIICMKGANKAVGDHGACTPRDLICDTELAPSHYPSQKKRKKLFNELRSADSSSMPYAMWAISSSSKTEVPCIRKYTEIIVRRAGLLWSQQDFEWRWSVPLFKCLTVLEFSFILFDLCLLITFFNFIMNYVPIVTFWIFTYHKIWILSIMFCFIWSYWIIYFLACLEVSWRVVS